MRANGLLLHTRIHGAFAAAAILTPATDHSTGDKDMIDDGIVANAPTLHFEGYDNAPAGQNYSSPRSR